MAFPKFRFCQCDEMPYRVVAHASLFWIYMVPCGEPGLICEGTIAALAWHALGNEALP